MLTYTQASVEGQTIAYATEGAGPSLLLLHGLGFDHRAWAAAAPYLIGHFRLIIPDMPGFGRSRGAAWDGQPEALVRLTGGLMTATQAVPAFVAGSGLGGLLALGLAARFPERVRAAIVVGSPGPELWPATSLGRLARAGLAVPGLAGALAGAAPRRVARRFLRASLSSGEPSPEIVGVVAETLRDPASRQALLRALGRLGSWGYLFRQLGGVRAPVLLVWGEHDELYGLPSAERLRHATPGARLVTLPGAGHALTLERPAELAAVIRQYLAPAVRPPQR